MAGAGNKSDACDPEILKQLLNETAIACQKCLVAVDNIATSQHQASASTPQLATPGAVTSVEIEAVEKLGRRCMELEHQLAAERSHKDNQLSDVQQRQIDDIILKYKERIKSIEDEKIALEDENRRLRVIIDQHKATNAALSQQVQSLVSESTTSRHESPHHSDDHVQFLTEQAQQFRADFESERRDRIAAEARINELQQQLAAANLQAHQLSLQQMQDISQRRQASLQYYREQYDSASHPSLPPAPPPPSSSSSRRQAGNRYSDGVDEVDDAAVDELDSVPNCLSRRTE